MADYYDWDDEPNDFDYGDPIHCAGCLGLFRADMAFAFTTCDGCQEEFCPECAEELHSCEQCDRSFCSSCVDYYLEDTEEATLCDECRDDGPAWARIRQADALLTTHTHGPAENTSRGPQSSGCALAMLLSMVTLAGIVRLLAI